MPASAHPLEPLRADELQRVVSAIRDCGKASPHVRFVSISLHEPPKDAVHGLVLVQRELEFSLAFVSG